MILFKILFFLIGHSVKKDFDGFDSYYSSDGFFLDSGWSYDTLILASIQSGNLAIHEAISWSKEDSVVLNIQRDIVFLSHFQSDEVNKISKLFQYFWIIISL